MEKGRSASRILDSSQMKSLDKRKHAESHDLSDVMYRRMKNRERQRRYRARKRLEADTKISQFISQPTPLQVDTGNSQVISQPTPLQVDTGISQVISQPTPPLQVDTRNSLVISQPSPPLQAELQLNGNPNSCVHHVPGRRDWKKDARRAHASKDKEDGSSASFSSAQTLTTESQTPCVSSGAKVESAGEKELQSDNSLGVANCETRRCIPGRRDWKAAARNKKSGSGC